MSAAKSVTCAQRLAPDTVEVLKQCNVIVDRTEADEKRLVTTELLLRTLDEYLPEPALLDGVLPSLVGALVGGATLEALEAAGQADLLPFMVLQAAHKVRGPKVVVRHYPHDVAAFAAAARLAAYAARRLPAHRHWRVHTVLFYWLANVALMPFPLASLADDAVVADLARVALDALASSSAVSKAAAHFLARFATRDDARHILQNAVDHCCACACAAGGSVHSRHGALRFLAAAFKVGRRDVLAPHTKAAMNAATFVAEMDDASTTDSHLATKLAQRVALAYLPPRGYSWAYKRGRRFLFGGATDISIPDQTTVGDGDVAREAEDKSIAASEEPLALSDDAQSDIESLLAVILGSLEHRDAVVRWSAAKGAGRVCARLDAVLGGEVVGHVLGSFDSLGDEGSWNGACLALAELLRRGLVLPRTPTFGRMVEALEAAACFERRRGRHSVGEHVRDAACYVVWALARAYDPEDIRPYAERVAKAMLRVALFDREVHCRRAAAAALQECVGRMPSGVIPDGIFLVTTADFFALGDRVAAYTNIAPSIAQCAQGRYFDAVLDEIVRKLKHWDSAIRALAAKALHAQIPNDRAKVIVDSVIPQLIDVAFAKGDVLHRHGAILGLAEVLDLHGGDVESSDAKRLVDLSNVLEKDGCFNGRSAEQLEAAICWLIRVLARTQPNVFVPGDERFVVDCLAASSVAVEGAAEEAFKALCENVFGRDEAWISKVQDTIVNGFSSDSVQRQRGFARAAGGIRPADVKNHLVKKLMEIATDAADPEVRCNAVCSLGCLSKGLDELQLNELHVVLVRSMQDYTIDDRGDIGSWVRQAAMNSTADVFENCGGLVSKNHGIQLIQGIIRQCVERINRTRVHAGFALWRAVQAVWSSELMVNEDADELWKVVDAISDVFKLAEIAVVDGGMKEFFNDTKRVFCAGVHLLDVDHIRVPVLQGLVAAAGGMGHQAHDAMEAILNSKLDTARLANDVAELFDDERIGPAGLRIVTRLAMEGLMDGASSEDVEGIAKRTRGCWKGRLKDVKRTTAAVALLGETAVLGAWNTSMEALVVVLSCTVPRLRRIAAEAIFVALVEKREAADKAIDRILDTPWERMKIMQAREARNEFCAIIGVNIPAPRSAAAR